MAHLRNQIFAILVSLSIFSASAATVVRGPYLQQGTDSSVIVRWRTDVATDGVVKYGLSSANLNLTAPTGPSTTEHTIAVSGLAADTKYFYSIGSTTETLAGGDSTHFVVTSPTAGAVTPFRAWVLGDSGTKDANAAAVRDGYLTYGAGQDTNLWIMLGDNAYNDGTDAEYQQAVFDMYPQILKNSVLWSTLGNHDGHSADSQALPLTGSGPYYDIFEFPIAGEAGGLPSGTEAYYSFDRGNVHFICLDSYDTDRSPTGPMMTWLENDLILNDKPWVVAYWHHPPYTKGSHNSDTEGRLVDMRQNALPILEMYGVDLVLSGHSHSYERSYLIDGHYGISTTFSSANQIDAGDGSETGDGAYQKLDAIAVPHAGAVFAVAGASGKISGGALNHPAMVVNLNVLGSMVLDFNDNRLDAVYLNSSGVVADEFTILKGADVTPPTLTSVTAEGSATNVEVVFSEDVEQTSAESSGNYSIDGGITVSAAALDPDGHTVNLTTSSMTNGFSYTLTVNNVTDVALNPIAANSQQAFLYLDTITIEFQQGVDGYSGASDTYLAEAAATTNFGSAATLLVDGDDGLGVDLAPLLRFDVSDIPAGSVVQSATLNLETFDPTTSVYSLYELKTAWSELGATWDESSSGVPWQAAGAQGTNDRDTAVLGTFSAPAIGNIPVALNVDGVSAVQGWVDSAGSNHGIIIADSTASNGGDIRSSDYATASLRPKLTVIYSMPAADTDPPTAPTSLTVDAVGETMVDLSWGASTDNVAVTEYRVYRDAAIVATVAGTSFGDIGLTPATAYNYQVTALDAAGNESAASNAVNPTTDAAGNPAVHIDSISLSLVNAKKNRYARAIVRVVDENGAAVAGATVNTQWSGLANDSDGQSTGGAGTATIDSNQVPKSQSGQFIITVMSVSAPGFDYDAGANVESFDCIGSDGSSCIVDTDPPANPTGLNATGGAGSASLSWNANSEGDLAGYSVYRSTSSGGGYGLVASGVGGTSYNDSGLVADTYYYVVTATDTSANESGNSNEASAVVTSGGGSTVHVASISPSTVKKGRRYEGHAAIVIVDQNGDPVSGAVVSTSWTLVGSPVGTPSGTTDGSGTANVKTAKQTASSGDEFVVTVTNVSVGGSTYDSAANVETSDSVLVS